MLPKVEKAGHTYMWFSKEILTGRLNSWFWVSFLYFGQGICSILFARLVKLPAESIFLPIVVLFLGGFVSLLFWRLGLPSGQERRWRWAVVVLLYVLFIYLMSSRSYPGVEVSFDTGYFHPVEYLTLGLLLGRFWYSVLETKGFFPFAARVMVAGAALGCADEIHQAFVPGRCADYWDFLMDLTGVFAATLVIAAIRRLTAPFTMHSRA